MFYFMLFLLLWNCSIITGFNIKSHFPASNSSHFPRLRMVDTLPSLQQFTLCSWVKFYSNDNKLLTLISYATVNSENQILITLSKYQSNRKVNIYMGETHSKFKCSLEWIIGKWYHLCATWFSPNSTAKIYQNGNVCEYIKSVKPLDKTIIPSGGILIVGQDQDGMDEKFDASQAWHGDIADLQIWDEELDYDQIREAGKCNGKRRAGNVFSWMKTRMVAIDNVVFSETQLCSP